jgi:uncharacterized membrane protein
MVFAFAGLGFIAGLLLSFAFGESVFGAGPISLGFLGGIFGWAMRRAITSQVTTQLAPMQRKLTEVSSALDYANVQLNNLQRQGTIAEFAAPPATQPSQTGDEPATLSDQPIWVVPNQASPQSSTLESKKPTTSTVNVNVLSPKVASITPATVSKPIEFPSQPSSNSKPKQPNAFDLGIEAFKNWFLGGNIILRVGMIILFIGLAFLARQAAINGYFPPELRLAIVGLAGIAAIAFGYIKRTVRPNFALPLQGFGVAILYLTVFAAFKLFGLIPQLMAFSLMVVICSFGVALALLQNSAALAFASFAGGFAAPILLSDGSGNHVGLFAYYLLLNIGILAVAFKRNWRALNLLGFVATYGVALTWGILKFSPENYASTQPFLIAFFLVYLLTAIFYAQKSPTNYGNTVDSMLVFGNPIITFGLQYGLTHAMPLGAGLSALGMSAVHIVAAFVVSKRDRKNNRLLMESFLAIGIGFLTLAIPLALDARWTSAIWAVEGLAAFWVGMRQRRWMLRTFGLALQLVAAVMYLDHFTNNHTSSTSMVHPLVFGALLLSVSAFVLSWWLRTIQSTHKDEGRKLSHDAESVLSSPLYVYGFALACVALVGQIIQLARVDLIGTMQQQSFMIIFGLMALLLVSLKVGRKFTWPIAVHMAKLSLPILAFGFIAQLTLSEGPAGNWGWIAWAVLFGIHWLFLKQYDDDLAENPTLSATADGGVTKTLSHVVSPERFAAFYGLTHAASIWLVTAFFAHCLYRAIEQAQLWGTSWASVTLLVAAILVVFGLTAFATKFAQKKTANGNVTEAPWPISRYAKSYAWTALAPMIPLLFIGTTLAAFASKGSAKPLPYIPLLNPTELTIALALGTLLFWRQRILQSNFGISTASQRIIEKPMFVGIAALTFIAINTVWFRFAHHYLDVAWHPETMLNSFVVQAGISILWSSLALALMVWAHKKLRRPVWLAGATLLALVVLKLLLVDMSNRGGTERIITFIAVGCLMLLVGWFAPMPPASKSSTTDKEKAARRDATASELDSNLKQDHSAP